MLCLVPHCVLTDVLSDPVAVSWGVQPAGGPNKPRTHRHCPLVQGPPLGTEERWNSGLDGKFPRTKPCRAAESQPGTEWPEFWEKPECFPGSQSCERWVLEESLKQIFLFFPSWYHIAKCFIPLFDFSLSGGGRWERSSCYRALQAVRPRQSPVVDWQISPQCDGPEPDQTGPDQLECCWQREVGGEMETELLSYIYFLVWDDIQTKKDQLTANFWLFF